MGNKKQIEWSDVKKVKFHHKVKRFYHKNTFRKGYTMVIVGLLLANIFSLFNYKTFANGYGYGYGYESCEAIGGDEWNTAELTTNTDGSKTITYDNKSYRIASGDLDGTYYRGFNENLDHSKWVSTNGTSPYIGTMLYENTNGINNAWGGSGDVAANGYDSGNPRSERQGPCDDGWHVPSKGEWQDIARARCHYRSDCSESHISFKTDYGNYSYILSDDNNLGAAFQNDFGMSYNGYWSSSPSSIDSAFYVLINGPWLSPSSIADRNTDVLSIRCLKDSIDNADPSTSSLTTTSEGYVLTSDGKSYTLALNDLDGRYYRGFNENTDHSKWLSTNGTSPYTGTILYGNTDGVNNAWGGGRDTAANGYDSGNPRSERQGPCEEGWHVPSIGERNDITTAWCHLSSNGCTSCDDWTENNNLIKIESYNKSLGSSFRSDFGMSDYFYWSSSPRPDESYFAWYLYVNDYSIYLDGYNYRSDGHSIRCIKDTVEDGGNGYGYGYGYGGEEPERDALIIPTTDNYEVNVGGYTYEDELPSGMTVTTNNEVEVDEPVLGEVSVNFGGNSNATFTELMQIKIPVEGATRAVVKVKHAGSEGYNFDGLTKNRNASCNENGRVVDDADKYVGETIRVVDGFVSIYTCEASSFIAVGEGPISSQIILEVEKGELTIGTETGTLDLGKVRVSNDVQELFGEFGANSFWVEDMKGVESGYYTTISVTDLSGNVSTHVIPANSVSLKTENGIPSYITGASVSESLVVFGNNITSWYNTWTAPVTYFNRVDTPSNLVGRVGKWGDNLQVKVTIPAHTPSDIYKGTITYTLYDLDL